MTPKEYLGEKQQIGWFTIRRRKIYRAKPLTRVLVAGGMIGFVCLVAAAMSGLDGRRRLSAKFEEATISHCNNDLDQIPGLAVTVYAVCLIFLFIGLAVVTDDFFVPSLTVMSDRLNLTEDVAGATLMASGSSAPELFTSLVDAFLRGTSIGVGTIVGSAVFNILVIIACSGAWATEALRIDWKPFSRDVTFYSLSIILLMVVISWDGRLSGEVYWWEGLIMFLCYGFYILIMIYNTKLMALLGKCCGEDREDDAEVKKEMIPLKREEIIQQEECIKLAFKPTNELRSKEIFYVFEPLAKKMVGVQNIWYDEQGSTIYTLSNRNQKKQLEDCAAKAIIEVCGACTNSIESVILNIDEVPKPAGGGHTGQKQDDKDSSNQQCCLLRILEGIVTFLVKCWSFFYGLHIPDVDSEELKDELQKDRNNSDLQAEIRKKERGYQLSFGLSIWWIAVICFAMVELAERIGCLIGIRPLFMGLTVIAAGTSIPDALGSISSAQRGMGDMAVANAIGSNVFDILIGLGLPWFLGGLYKQEPFVVQIDDLIIFIAILFGTIFLTLGAFLIANWRLGKTVGIMLLTLYIMFLVFAFLYVYI